MEVDEFKRTRQTVADIWTTDWEYAFNARLPNLVLVRLTTEDLVVDDHYGVAESRVGADSDEIVEVRSRTIMEDAGNRAFWKGDDKIGCERDVSMRSRGRRVDKTASNSDTAIIRRSTDGRFTDSQWSGSAFMSCCAVVVSSIRTVFMLSSPDSVGEDIMFSPRTVSTSVRPSVRSFIRPDRFC